MFNRLLILNVFIFIIGIILSLFGSSISNDFVTNLGYFLTGLSVAGPFIIYISDEHFKVQSLKTQVDKIKIVKQKSLPIYRTRNTIFYITCLVSIIVFSIYYLLPLNSFILPYSLLIAIFLLIVYRIQRKKYMPLKIYKDSHDSNECYNYNTNIPNLNEFSMLLNLLRKSSDSESIRKNRAEYLEVYKYDNIVNFWTIITQAFSSSNHSNIVKSNRYIFANINYVSNSSTKRILLVNNSYNFLKLKTDNNFIVSKYSNLHPFLVNSVNDNKELIEQLSKVCSEFFSRTRFKYVLMISENSINICLSNAKLGQFYRILNKSKTKKLINEAIDEISKFLVLLKSIIEKYDTNSNPGN